MLAYRNRRSGTVRIIIGLLAALVVSGGLGWYLMSQRFAGACETTSTYTEPKQCQACHAQIHRDYQHVGMARSFRSVGSEFISGSFYHARSGRHYRILPRDGRLFQRRYELDAKGLEANQFELEITHTIGSGNHARSYFHRLKNGEIIQLPLTWYTQEQSWGMSPGYDNAAPPDFTRLVDDSCLFCHNAYPLSESSLGEGIDCQRCHGPGSLHVQLASKVNPAVDKVRAAIVNPKRFGTELQMDICMQCHLETTSAHLPQMIRRLDRAAFSFRPGEQLGSYMVHFDHPPGTGHDDKFEIVNQAYRLRQSACFKESGGRLTCSSCHNPHAVPRGTAAVAQYRDKCIACHSAVQKEDHPNLHTANCVACHMPRRRAEDAVHVVMTDHLIQRRPTKDPTQPLSEHAAAYRGALTVYYPPNLPAKERDLYLGIALISGGADRQQGIALLEKAAERDAPAKALAILGEGYFAEGKANSAVRMFERAIAQEPALVKARYNLGKAFEAVDRFAQARAAFERALALQPDFAEAEYALANLLVKTGQQGLAEQHYLNAIRIRPVYADAHNDLARLYAQRNRVPEALDHAKHAVAIDLGHVEARYNLARLLQETGAIEAALAEYRKVLAIQPDMVAAHLSLGQALGDAGRLDAAISQFRKVLQLRPGHAEAQKNLDLALSLKYGSAR
jgi:predicted CXXCH cytochrome family protein